MKHQDQQRSSSSETSFSFEDLQPQRLGCESRKPHAHDAQRGTDYGETFGKPSFEVTKKTFKVYCRGRLRRVGVTFYPKKTHTPTSIATVVLIYVLGISWVQRTVYFRDRLGSLLIQPNFHFQQLSRHDLPLHFVMEPSKSKALAMEVKVGEPTAFRVAPGVEVRTFFKYEHV